MKTETFKLKFNNKEILVQIKNLAEQANGSVLVRAGDTMVLTTCVMAKMEREGLDFFPLTVDYEERYYAAGKIRGPRYIKRESRPSDEAILNARLIDRAIRPLFPEKLRKEVQVIITVLSWDKENDPDVLGLLGASIALSISDIPWAGPIAGLRVCGIEGNYIINPTYQEKEKSELDIVVSATAKDEEILINMLEAQAEQVKENRVVEAMNFSENYLKELINFQEEIKKKIGKEKILLPETPIEPELETKSREFLGERLENALFQKEKQERQEDLSSLKEEFKVWLENNFSEKKSQGLDFFEKEIKRTLNENVLKYEKRPDSRKLNQLREVSTEVAVLPRTHGSGLFCRGQTKALSILTLGAPGDQQILEGMEIVGKKRFMHHYNFPPYCSGEVKPVRGPGRREIGHGCLAEKSLLPLIPSYDEFPYTIRIVTEILSSNGSTSMASVSSSSLALMDAGVPIKSEGGAAGISLGLIFEAGNYKILTDIQGPEDHYGDMDFKIAGTKEGITAVQLDVKIAGINKKILAETLERGKEARNEILGIMEKTISAPRPELSPWAPRIYTLQINPEKIREVIGPGGKVINEIIGETGVSIDIEDSGKILITSESESSAQKAVAWIKNIVREVVPGEVFQGKVKRILSFGAIVEILPGQEGLIHISKLATFPVRRVEDIIKVGDILSVKVIAIDEQGRINLAPAKRR